MTHQDKIRELKDRLSRTKSVLKDLLKYGRKENLQREIASARKSIKHLKQRIRKLIGESKGLLISEHAIVRYMERVHGIDIEDIKKEIVGGNPAKMQDIPTGTYVVNNHKIKVRNNIVVTVLP